MVSSPRPQRFLPYGRQYIDDADIEAVKTALTSDFLTTGPKVKEFEDRFAELVGAEYTIAVSNGTTALHLACIAAGLNENSAAVVPTVTFLATANAVRYCNADVIFADVDPQTGMLTGETLKAALSAYKGSKEIKAILPVHLGGRCADMEEIRAIADHYNLKIITDCAHAIGSQYKIGNQAHYAGSCEVEDLATFSFHPVKTIAMGEGGAITVKDPEVAKRIRRLRHHGMEAMPEMGLWYYEMPELGYNYREPDILCALGISQLEKIQSFLESRDSSVKKYNKILGGFTPVLKTPDIPDVRTGWHLYAIAIDFEKAGITRNEVMLALKERGIGSQVHYIPVHTQPYYRNLYGDFDLSGASEYYKRTLSLPLFPYMEDAEIQYVCENLIDVLKLA